MEMTDNQLKAMQLRNYQAMPLGAKVTRTKELIRQALEHFDDQMYVAFSGGVDSTVMLDLVWSVDPTIPAVFSDTGNELESIREFVRGYGDRVVWVEPDMTFDEVVDKWGYPVVSKKMSDYINRCRRTKSERVIKRHRYGLKADGSPSPMSKIPAKWWHLVEGDIDVTNRCCGILKDRPTGKYREATGRFAFVGTMAEESMTRRNSYLNEGGCNAFSQKDPCSRPVMFWTGADMKEYIVTNDLKISSAYGEIVEQVDGSKKFSGHQRTGCKFCLFGIHLEPTNQPNRIQKLYTEEPEAYFHCIVNLHYDVVMNELGVDWRPFKEPDVQTDMFDARYEIDVKELHGE